MFQMTTYLTPHTQTFVNMSYAEMTPFSDQNLQHVCKAEVKSHA
ncbi:MULTISPECIES: hypothetical protein [Paenibacillus]|uniref:Uncharacterized protein n=1 Tax=Paenibacillus urinalis TaxID=521520 RepID=A0AAX3MVQ8_9BACL|nr:MULTISPECIES: hypothetical protein [Paenibacillus]WDH81685.1 hypothetical protein PUW23_19530 [Paenibacillus urinalis]WDI01405.1 hypothetical protein PUW25_19385 [Paenibacillus urinalis]